MRNYLTKFIIILIFIVGFESFAQQINLDENEVTELLCKTCKIEYGTQTGKKITGMEDAQKDKYIFNPDHTYDLKSTTSENIGGEWKYNIEKKLIELSMNEIPFGQIINLNNEEMVITSSGMPGAKFHLKPTE